MAVSAKIKNLAPGAYFNAGPVEVVVLEHFTDGRTLLAAKEPIGNRPFTVRPFTYNRMEPEPAANMGPPIRRSRPSTGSRTRT